MFTLFSHNNNTLSIILETIYKNNYAKNIYIREKCEIVSFKDLELKEYMELISEERINFSYGNPYQTKNITTEDISILQYNKNDNESKKLISQIDPKLKKIVYELLKIKDEEYSVLIDCSASISSTSKIGIGSFISSLSSIGPYVELKRFVSINRNVSIGHHSIVSDFSTLNPGCNIAGNCIIGKGVTIGIGANIIDSIVIGDNSFIGAGSVVTKNIPSNVVAYGVPAKIIRNVQ